MIVHSVPSHTSTQTYEVNNMCGIAGISGTPDAAAIIALALHALQHRGQEAAGVVSREFSPEETLFYQHREAGLVGDSLFQDEAIRKLHGDAALGHVRYSTAGAKHVSRSAQIADAQPLLRDGVALVHNGNLTNAKVLRDELMGRGFRFQTEVDTEVLMQLIVDGSSGTLVGRIEHALERVEGAYSLIILSRKKLIGIRDPLGIRPLIFGRVGEEYAFASETCAFEIVRGEVIDEVKPGEMVVVEDGEVSRHRFAPTTTPRPCIFEDVYFSRPDSVRAGESMFLVRSRLGRQLAREDVKEGAISTRPVDDVIIVPVLDSGLPAAIGYANETGWQFSPALVRNHYVGRYFIEPIEGKRDLKVRSKHSANKALVSGKRVVLVDDSVVRGTTSRLIVELLRDAGAKEVHLRIASAPIMHACHHGIDTHAGELLALGCSSIGEASERLRLASGADSVKYLPLEDMVREVRCSSQCDACFSGKYPTPLTDMAQL